MDLGRVNSDIDLSMVEDLIAVWRNDELLNTLGAVKEADNVPTPFDVSADRELVELLLVWRVDSEPDAVRDGEYSDGSGAAVPCQPQR